MCKTQNRPKTAAEWAAEVDTTGWYESDGPLMLHLYPGNGKVGILVCKCCGRRFPDRYERKSCWSPRTRRGKQYFRLAAQNNFWKHVEACRKGGEQTQ